MFPSSGWRSISNNISLLRQAASNMTHSRYEATSWKNRVHALANVQRAPSNPPCQWMHVRAMTGGGELRKKKKMKKSSNNGHTGPPIRVAPGAYLHIFILDRIMGPYDDAWKLSRMLFFCLAGAFPLPPLPVPSESLLAILLFTSIPCIQLASQHVMR